MFKSTTVLSLCFATHGLQDKHIIMSLMGDLKGFIGWNWSKNILPKNLLNFTTKFIMDENEPILIKAYR